MTSFHHSVRFGDLAIPTAVGVVMMTLMTLMMMNFFQLERVTARTGVGYAYQHPVLQPIFNRQPLIWSICREWQDIVSRGLFWTSMLFPSVEQPTLEASQPALVLLHE